MSLGSSDLALLPSKYPHQRTREISQEASISDGNSSGTETDRTPRAIYTSSFPSISPSSDANNSSPASFSSSSTITGRAPRIRVSTVHKRAQSDASSLSNLQPLIIASSLEKSRPNSEVYGSANPAISIRRRSHGRTPSTIATPNVIPTRKSRASTVSSADVPRRTTGLHYKKPSLSTICKLPSTDENLAGSDQDAPRVVTPLSGKRRSKALSEALSSRRRSSTISGGPPPSFDATDGQQKLVKEVGTKSHRRSRTRGGSVSAVRSIEELDRDLQLQLSRSSSSIVHRPQDEDKVANQNPAKNCSEAPSNFASSPASELCRSGFSTSNPTSSPPVDSLDWASFIDEGYNLSPISSCFSAASLAYPVMSRTSSQATTVSAGESLVRTISGDSKSSSSSHHSSATSSSFRPHSRSSYEPTGVDWLDEELACASSDEEDLLLDQVLFPRPRSRIETNSDEGKSPKQEIKRLPPSIPLPSVVNEQISHPESSPNMTFVTPPSSPNPGESPSTIPSTIHNQKHCFSLPRFAPDIGSESEESSQTQAHSLDLHLTAAQRYATYASRGAIKPKLKEETMEDPMQRLALQSAYQAVFGDASQGSSLVSRRSKKTIAPLSSVKTRPQKSLPATPNELSPPSIPSVQIELAGTQAPLGDPVSGLPGNEEVESQVVSPLSRRDGALNRPDTASSSGSEALSVSSSSSNQGWGRGSCSTDASSLLGSPCSPSSALLHLQGGEAMFKSASAGVGSSFTPMRPPRSPRRGSFDALSQATGSAAPSPAPKPLSAFSAEIKPHTSPKRRGSKKLPKAPIRLTSLENAVGADPSSMQIKEPNSLLGGWLSQDDAPPDGRVSPCPQTQGEESDGGEESWWSGEEEETQKNLRDFESFLGDDDDEMSNQQYVKGGARVSAPSKKSSNGQSSESLPKPPKLSAAAAKRLGLSMDGTVPSTIAGRMERARQSSTAVPAYPASPINSKASRASAAFPPYPGTDPNFSDKSFVGKNPPSFSKSSLGTSRRLFTTRNKEDRSTSTANFERPVSVISFRDRFGSDATAGSSDRAASSLGFYNAQSAELSNPHNTASGPSTAPQSSFLGLKARSSQIDLDLSPSSLVVPSDPPRLKLKLSNGSFGFSKSESSKSNQEGKKKFSSVKMKKSSSSKDPNNIFYKVWA